MWGVGFGDSPYIREWERRRRVRKRARSLFFFFVHVKIAFVFFLLLLHTFFVLARFLDRSARDDPFEDVEKKAND